MTTIRRVGTNPLPRVDATLPLARSQQPRAGLSVRDSFETLSATATATTRLGQAALDESSVQALVGDTYRKWLRRDPDSGGEALWTATAMDQVRSGWSQQQLQTWLDTEFARCPERQALETVDQVFASELGRDVSDSRGYWHDRAAGWASQGTSVEDLRQRLTDGLRESDEFRQGHMGELVRNVFQEELGRPGGEGFWTDKANELVAQGKPTAEIESYLRTQFRGSDEFRNNLVKRVFSEVMGREGGEGYWTEQAKALAQQGKSLDEIESYLRAQFRSSTEYGLAHVDEVVPQVFEEEMGRPGGQGFWTDWAKERLNQGRSLTEVADLMRGELRRSDEYRLGHLDQIVAGCYRDVLGREADPAGMGHFLGVAEQLKSQGKLPGEIEAAIAAEMRESPEFAQKQGGRWVGKVPEINQLGPSGNDGSYWNGSSNCGPTSLAMVARAVGWGGNLTDAQLVMEMYRRAGTQGENGTGVNGIGNALGSIGLHTETHWVNTDVEGMAQALRDGKLIVANGDFYALGVPGRYNTGDSGHYLVVEGLDAQGNFIVDEPWGGAEYHVSPESMRRFLAEWPGGPGGNWVAAWP